MFHGAPYLMVPHSPLYEKLHISKKNEIYSRRNSLYKNVFETYIRRLIKNSNFSRKIKTSYEESKYFHDDADFMKTSLSRL